MRTMTQTEKKRWATQWRSAAKALAIVKRREIAALTDDDTRRSVAWLLADTVAHYKNPKSRVYSGLVDQQRYFKRCLRKKRAGVGAA